MEKIIFLLTFVFQLSWTFLFQEQDFSLGTHIAKPFRMIISNALPVQFWDEAEETFNEKQVCGIDQICWCMPWHCADTIPFQFTDSFGDSEPEEETIPETLPALTSWLTSSLDVDNYDWTTGAAPTVNLPGTGPFEPDSARSEYLYVDHAFLEGYEYEITLNYTRVINSGISNPRTAALFILDTAYNIQFSDAEAGEAGANSIVLTFTATESCDRIGFTFNTGSNNDITVNSVSATRTGPAPVTPPDPIDYKLRVLNSSGEVIQTHDFEPTLIDSNTYLYELPFNPEEQGLCDNQVSFQIIDSDASPDSVIKKSDCLQIKESIDCTLAIDYSNNKNFNGLVFEDISPTTTFRIRIPGRLFDGDNPSEQEDIELSNSEIVRLYNKLEERGLLEIGFVPNNYMHRKIQLALMCDNVTINGRRWIRREAYEKVEGRKTYPLKRANVWLHDKDFIKENQL